MEDLFEKFRHILNKGPVVPAGPANFVVAGLGNPGEKYENSRHNVGFLAVDHIAREWGFAVNRMRFHSQCGEVLVEGRRVLFLKPNTYMNLSGQAVGEALRYHKLGPDRLIVISDDVSLDVGAMRIRRSGSDGGQKGLRSIIEHIGSDQFSRIRIGVGKKPHPDMELADWVLSRFTAADREAIAPLLEHTLQAVELLIQGNIDEAMRRYN